MSEPAYRAMVSRRSRLPLDPAIPPAEIEQRRNPLCQALPRLFRPIESANAIGLSGRLTGGTFGPQHPCPRLSIFDSRTPSCTAIKLRWRPRCTAKM